MESFCFLTNQAIESRVEFGMRMVIAGENMDKRTFLEQHIPGENISSPSWLFYAYRSYYRCTFRNTQNCWAVKQVQRSDEDPSVFEITYRGKHTCSQGNYLAQSFHSPEKQEKKENEHDDDHHQKQPSQENLLGYQTFENIGKLENKASTFCFGSTSGGCKNIENSDFSRLAIDTHASLGNFSQSFISPTTPDSNYFTPSPCQRSHVGGAHNVHQSESDVHEIFSANTSATNSPILDWDFPFDAEHINPNFPFNSPGFFY